jgi:hypothetical protein
LALTDLQDEFCSLLDRRDALGGAAQQNYAFERRQHLARYLRSSLAAGNHTRSC